MICSQVAVVCVWPTSLLKLHGEHHVCVTRHAHSSSTIASASHWSGHAVSFLRAPTIIRCKDKPWRIQHAQMPRNRSLPGSFLHCLQVWSAGVAVPYVDNRKSGVLAVDGLLLSSVAVREVQMGVSCDNGPCHHWWLDKVDINCM
jgi:hypothetical protein